ncbi:Phytoene/squalene synthetase-like protein [Roseibacterium elongatum DSM 19469]|uniref:Phytoene/squalene synthetase-like protein n=1 Tax=Roseicyclus elongatus DSM 19469 TaxID=1294273 RepID=W8S532_9RHOB|nr:squalene/phytoene synthase family protein [Roseibacterium elongatum]AHM05337.1 Phytoene/squalene synthetase-like protein [Roseibacterium elongatum DSM 19469]
MSVASCAELVARADPERFRATMAAPVAAREVLFPLYAFNIEVSRAPWVTKEPMIAEMRLQFWRDVVEEIAAARPPRAHEVAAPLAQVADPQVAPLLDGLIAARRWDIYRDPFEDEAHFDAYLAATGSNLAWAAARLLGAPEAAERAVRDHAWAAALAGFLRAVPELAARGRVPLVDGRPEAVADLARQGLARLEAARAARRTVPRAAAPALFAGWQAEAILTQAARTPVRVAEGTLGQSEAASRLGLLRLSLTGRW